MRMPKTHALCLISIVISCGGLPTNYEYQYAPEHDYAKKDYSFSYGVKDLHTGDVKNQWEKKTGDQVRGHYSVVEPDGSLRIVDYTVDGKSGFKAVVKHKGVSYHPSKKPSSYNEVLLKNREKLEEISAILNQSKDEDPYNYSHLTINEEISEDDKAIPSNHKSVYTKLQQEVNSEEAIADSYLKDTIVTNLNPKEEEYYYTREDKVEPEKKVIYYVPENEGESVEEKKPAGEEVKFYYYAEEDNAELEKEQTKPYYFSGEKLKKEQTKPYYFSGETLPDYYKERGLSKSPEKPKYEKIHTLHLQENLKPLPIDLSLLNKGVSFEIDHLKPVVIDLSKNLSGSGFKTPIIEEGFKPVSNKYSQPMPDVDNTYVSNVQPKTTPGLINYAGGYYTGVTPALKPLPLYKGPSTNKNGPVQFPSNNGNGNGNGRGKVRRNPGQNHSVVRRPKIMKLTTYYNK